MAKKGAVKKDKIVAISINSPIWDEKTKNITMVPAANIPNHVKYPILLLKLKSSLVVSDIALGEASKVVIVVLNIVENAAIPIK